MNDGMRDHSAVDTAADVDLPVIGGPSFVLRSPGRTLEAHGCRARLPAGGTETLVARVGAFFAGIRTGEPVLVGALPFDPDAADALHQPLSMTSPQSAEPTRMRPFVGDVRDEPSPATYARWVREALGALEDGRDPLRKVVLARSLRVQGAVPFEPMSLAARLGQDPGVVPYVVALPVDAGEAPAWLVGASPELLVSRRGLQVLSHPLAGSARRRADPLEDAAAAQALLASAKDHDEHRYVVEAITDALTPWCVSLQAPAQPALERTASMWHLGTRIEATLRDPATPVAALLAALHPTPAVCGTPRAAALAAIRALEPQSRGFYAGAVGWMDAQGDGEWYVAIRCARVQGHVARVYAGAGIVAGSQPALEVAETAAKFGALLTALGVQATPDLDPEP
jgi:isochorismate synthase